MLAVALALGAALGWGISDFLGGLRSRTTPLLAVLVISQATALAVLVVVVAARGVAAPDVGSLGFAAVAGVSEAVAVAALYRGFAVGMMSVVAPVAAIAPVLPVGVGLVIGEVPGPVEGAGLALAVAGVTVTSFQRRSDDAPASRTALTRSLLYGLVAAIGFGMFFAAMDRASEVDVPWALLIARLSAVTLIATAALVRRVRLDVGPRDVAALAPIGLLIVAADSFYAAASTVGLVGVVSVLSSLHTVVTIGMARVVLDERLQRPQQIGIATTLFGVLAIAAA